VEIHYAEKGLVLILKIDPLFEGADVISYVWTVGSRRLNNLKIASNSLMVMAGKVHLLFG
jgi:hypothetical protein